MSLTSYGDRNCKFAAFISYAFADNDASGGWIEEFYEELKKMLSGMLQRVDGSAKGLRLAHKNGEISGNLAQVLTGELDGSFALIIVVYRNYPTSSWCFEELKHFRLAHRDTAVDNRIFLVALSKSQIEMVAANPAWKGLGLNKNIWINAYDPEIPDDPMPTNATKGNKAVIDREFRRVVRSIGNKIAKLASAPLEPSPTPVDGARILVSCTAADLIERAMALEERLKRDGRFEVERISVVEAQAAAADSEPLQAKLVKFTDLILPFHTGEPLCGMSPGGHLRLIENAWIAAHGSDETSRRIHWVDYTDIPPSRPADERRHGAALSDIKQRSVKEFDLPFSPVDSAAVTILIESNPEERHEWELLRDRIAEIWVRIAGGGPGTPAVAINFRELKLDGEETVHTSRQVATADAVLLLWGKKPFESVAAVINTQGKRLTQHGNNAMGIVARLLAAEGEACMERDIDKWIVVRFNRDPPPDGLHFIQPLSDTFTLEGILGEVLRRRGGGGTGGT